MGTYHLPSDLPCWPEVRSRLLDLHDRLMDQAIEIQEVCCILQTLNTIVQSESHDSPKDADDHRLQGLMEDVWMGQGLDTSSLWYDIMHWLEAKDHTEQDHFLYFTLPGVILFVMALEDTSEENKLGWSRHQRHGQAVLSKQFVCSVIASLFLGLFTDHDQGSVTWKGFHQLSLPSDGWKLQSVLDYFDRVIRCATVGGNITIHRKTLPAQEPITLDDLVNCDQDLCPVTLHSGDWMEEREDDRLHIHFSSKTIGGQGGGDSGNIKDNSLMWLYPELMAVLLEERTQSNEVLSVAGFEKFSHEECSEEAANQQAGVELDRSHFHRLVLVDGESRHCKDDLEETLLRTLNWTLFGFSGKAFPDDHLPVNRLSMGEVDDGFHGQSCEKDSKGGVIVCADKELDELSVVSTQHSCMKDEAFGTSDERYEVDPNRQQQPKQLYQHQQQQQQLGQVETTEFIPGHLHHHQGQQQPSQYSLLPAPSISSSSSLSLSTTSSSSTSLSSYLTSSPAFSSAGLYHHQHHHHQSHQHHDRNFGHSITNLDLRCDEVIVSSSPSSPSSLLLSNSHTVYQPGASTTQHIPLSISPPVISSSPLPHPHYLSPCGEYGTRTRMFRTGTSSEVTNSENEHDHHAKEEETRDANAADINYKTCKSEFETVDSALTTLPSQTSTIYPVTPATSHRNNNYEVEVDVKEEFLNDILGNLPRPKPGARHMITGTATSAFSPTASSSFVVSKDEYCLGTAQGFVDPCPRHQLSAVSTTSTTQSSSLSSSSPPICDRSEVNATLALRLPSLPTPHEKNCDAINASWILCSNPTLNASLETSTTTTARIDHLSYSSSSSPFSKSPTLSSPLRVEIPPIPYTSTSCCHHSKNLSDRVSRNRRHHLRHRAYSHEQQQHQQSAIRLEPPLSSSPQSSASSLNTSPNSSFTLPEPMTRRTLSVNSDVEVTADFFIPGLDHAAMMDQDNACLVPTPGTNGSRDFHNELQDLISSSSSTSGSSFLLSQCVPSSSGCSHWGSRSGSISSHGTNGSSNDFVEFWYNLRRRSSQLSDASRRSSSSKHSSDFSTDLEDISEKIAKHSHEIIEEEGGVMNILSDFASQFVSTAVHKGTSMEGSVDGDDNDEVEPSTRDTGETGGRDNDNTSVTMGPSVGSQDTDGFSLKSFTSQATGSVEQDRDEGAGDDGLVGQECHNQSTGSVNESVTHNHPTDAISIASSPPDSAFISASASLASPCSSRQFSSAPVKEIPPSQINFSPPQREQTLELWEDSSTSFAVLESKMVLYLEEQNKLPPLPSPSSQQTTIDFSSDKNSQPTEAGKASIKFSLMSCNDDDDDMEVQQQTATATTFNENVKSIPSPIPHSSIKVPTSKSHSQSPMKLHSHHPLPSYTGATSTTKTAVTTVSVLKPNTKTSTSLLSSSFSHTLSSKLSNTPSQHDDNKTSSNIPRLKVSSKSHSSSHKSQPASHTVATKTASTSSFHKQDKDKQRSPFHSPRSRYVFSDVAAPLDKGKPKSKQVPVVKKQSKKGSKANAGVRRSPEHKRMVARKALNADHDARIDLTTLLPFWHFVNVLAEQALSQAVLEGAEILATPHQTNEDRAEDLSDEVYTWFADKIIHQVFFRVLESLETKEDGEDDDNNSLVDKDETTNSCLDSPSHDGKIQAWLPQHDNNGSNDGNLSSVISSSCLLSSSSSAAPIKPTLHRHKSIGSLSSGRASGLNKTVSFEDANREPVRTGSEGDLSRRSSFHYSPSFGHAPVFQERPSSAGSSGGREHHLPQDFPHSFSHRVPANDYFNLARIHRRLSKSTTDLPRWGSLPSIDFPWGGGSPTNSYQNLTYYSDFTNGRVTSRSGSEQTWRGSLSRVDSTSRGSLINTSIDVTDGSGTNVDILTRPSNGATDEVISEDIYQAAVSIVNQVFASISDSLDLEAHKAEDLGHDPLYPGSGSQHSGFSSNIFSSSNQRTSSSNLKRAHRSVSPNVGIFSRKPMSRESLTNAFLKVDSQPSVQNYERRSSEPCHTSVQLSLEVFNKNRYNYKPAEEPQQTACTDDDIGRTSSNRISWQQRRGSLDNFSFGSHGNNICGFKDPILSRFAEELMKADTSVPELVFVGSNPSSCTTGSRRSSISGFRDTTLANLESELLNTSFTSMISLPLSQSPRSQAGRSHSRVRSKSWERSAHQEARSDSSDTEHWFPPPRVVGEEFQLEFNRQHSQGQEEFRDFASMFAGCVVQEAVCVIKSDPDYQTDEEMAISLYAENLTDQILRDAFLLSRGHKDQGQAPEVKQSQGEDNNVVKNRRTIRRVSSGSNSDSRRIEGKAERREKPSPSYFGEGARPKVKTSASRSGDKSVSAGNKDIEGTTTRKKSFGSGPQRHHGSDNDTERRRKKSGGGFGYAERGGTNSVDRERKRTASGSSQSSTHQQQHHHHHQHQVQQQKHHQHQKQQYSAPGSSASCGERTGPGIMKSLDKKAVSIKSTPTASHSVSATKTEPKPTSASKLKKTSSAPMSIRQVRSSPSSMSVGQTRTSPLSSLSFSQRFGGSHHRESKESRQNRTSKSDSRVKCETQSKHHIAGIGGSNVTRAMKSSPLECGELGGMDRRRTGGEDGEKRSSSGRQQSLPIALPRHKSSMARSKTVEDEGRRVSHHTPDRGGRGDGPQDQQFYDEVRDGLHGIVIGSDHVWQGGNVSPARSLSSSSVNEMGSSLLSCDESDFPCPPVVGGDGRRKKKITRQNAVWAQRREARSTRETHREAKHHHHHHLHHHHHHEDRSESHRSDDIGLEEADDDYHDVDRGFSSPLPCSVLDRITTGLSHQIISDALTEVELLPWWRWFPTCNKSITSNTRVGCTQTHRTVSDWQLQFVMQWVAASLVRCPQLVCVIDRWTGLEEVENIVHLLSSWSVGTLASAIVEYKRSLQHSASCSDISTGITTLQKSGIAAATTAVTTVSSTTAVTTTRTILSTPSTQRTNVSSYHKEDESISLHPPQSLSSSLSSSSSISSSSFHSCPSFFQFLLDVQRQTKYS